MKINLKNKVVVITGASQGIGAATAREFVKYGCSIVLAARSTDLIDEITKEINDSGGNALAVKTDVSNKDDIKNLSTRTLDKYGKIDIWINNAGFSINYDSLYTKESWVEQIFDVNLNAVYWGMRNAAQAMMKNESKPRGIIVNISSIAAEFPVAPKSILYTTTKVAVDTLSKGVAMELASSDIKVINIKPGFTATNFHNNRMGPKKKTNINEKGYLFFKSVTPEKVAGKIISSIQKGKNNNRVLVTINDYLFFLILKPFFPLVRWIMKKGVMEKKPDPLLDD